MTNVAGHKVLVIVTGFTSINALDGMTGARVWSNSNLPLQNLGGCGFQGLAGTPAYDPALHALFVMAGSSATPNHVILYKINVGTGNINGRVDITPSLLPGESVSAHTAVTFANGLLYLGTASACENASWRGRILSVDPSTLTIQNTFFPTYGVRGANYGGGSIWAWGGVSADAGGNIYAATGNTETKGTTGGTIEPPFTPTTDEQAGYGEHLLKLSSDLSTVEDANYPGFNFQLGFDDLDYTGSPVLFTPNGCDQFSATQGKGGTLVINDTKHLANPTSYLLSEPSGLADYIGNPAYSPNTQLLYAAVASSQDGSLEPPGMVALQFTCGSSILWHAQFGPDSFGYEATGDAPRSSPTVTSGGVVFMGTPCTSNNSGGCGAPGAVNGALWAVDASTGNVLDGGNPALVTTDDLRMAPVADGEWLYMMDNSGNVYALTVDPAVKAVAERPGTRAAARIHYRR